MEQTINKTKKVRQHYYSDRYIGHGTDHQQNQKGTTTLLFGSVYRTWNRPSTKPKRYDNIIILIGISDMEQAINKTKKVRQHYYSDRYIRHGKDHRQNQKGTTTLLF